ncbi:beta-N-acetylhexosaminidase [Devosia rhodophyticola]|uniref:beta-N-acetylhexosaminidase n=1 Tax=Devosia rhodophyticola TaxID=3026423 RepID=A0ABY7YYK6_9HYPH|nr:beta-N-acetylhexosaminidase [Devosia rhodophyticola]WDR05865.1 beta-N-acetylhexosaminidase [Devosia rhodophyticola]
MTSGHVLNLETIWKPATGEDALAYVIKLTNNGANALRGFKLAINGPARIDPLAKIEGASLEARLSNHTVFAHDATFELGVGQTWEIVVHGLSYGLRHWSDGANSAYVILDDGTTQTVSTTPTLAVGVNAPLLKGAMRFPMPSKVPATISVIPWPNSVTITGARTVPAGLDLQPQSADARKATAAFGHLVADLFPVEGLVRPAAEGGITVRLADKPGMDAEAYEIQFFEASATIFATTHSGFLYGLITLGQILRGAKQHPQQLVFPNGGKIIDAPGLAWRGCHLDVARQFYSSAEVSRLLKVMAWNKMNRFHWHLSEDEAWRVEIDAFPELTEIGAWRGHGKALPPLLGSGPQPTGGYYSKAAIRDIVALGESIGVAIVPEIDIPGHCYALLQSLPQLRDPNEVGEYQSVQGFPNNCLNPGNPAVYRFMEIIIDEMLELFPAGIFHLGADEVPLAAWSGSPMALELLTELAGKETADKHAQLVNTIGNLHGADEIEGSGTAILQAEFIRRVHEYIASKGATTGGWEEAAHGNVVDKSKTYLVGWRNVAINAALAADGYDIVVSPGQHYYLDMANSLSWSEPGAGWAGWSGPEETYQFEPRQGWTEEQLQHLMGVQSCIWSEPMTDRAIFDRLVFPRLSAVAEAGWTEPENKSWPRFSAFAGLMPIMYGHWAE